METDYDTVMTLREVHRAATDRRIVPRGLTRRLEPTCVCAQARTQATPDATDEDSLFRKRHREASDPEILRVVDSIPQVERRVPTASLGDPTTHRELLRTREVCRAVRSRHILPADEMGERAAWKSL